MSKNPEFVKFDKVDKSYDGKVLVVKDLQPGHAVHAHLRADVVAVLFRS